MRVQPRAFAFVKTGEFSHANRQVLAQLQSRFPDMRAHVIELEDLPVLSKRDVPGLIAAVAKEFGPAALLGTERFRKHIVKTGYRFERARAALLEQMTGRRFAFTFQTQLLFDASIPGTPHFVYTDHTHLENLKYPDRTAATPLSASWIKLEAQAYRNAHMVFTMSQNIARSLVEQYGCPPGRIACVCAGSNVTAAAVGELHAGRFNAKNILFVGVDWERKGGPVLLEAFRAVRRRHPEATLTIVGCSPSISHPGVQVVGRVPLEVVAEHYRRASVFCLPTLNEPFGFVFLEAFTYGLPVVATRLGAIPEIVSEGESGYLVTPHSAEQLVQRLNQLLDDPERCARFGAHGQAWVARRYTWDETGRRMASFIQRAVRQNSLKRRGVGVATGSGPVVTPVPAAKVTAAATTGEPIAV